MNQVDRMPSRDAPVRDNAFERAFLATSRAAPAQHFTAGAAAGAFATVAVFLAGLAQSLARRAPAGEADNAALAGIRAALVGAAIAGGAACGADVEAGALTHVFGAGAPAMTAILVVLAGRAKRQTSGRDAAGANPVRIAAAAPPLHFAIAGSDAIADFPAGGGDTGSIAAVVIRGAGAAGGDTRRSAATAIAARGLRREGERRWGGGGGDRRGPGWALERRTATAGVVI
jgi:hypothetical protein